MRHFLHVSPAASSIEIKRTAAKRSDRKYMFLISVCFREIVFFNSTCKIDFTPTRMDVLCFLYDGYEHIEIEWAHVQYGYANENFTTCSLFGREWRCG